ncbi:MAG TPA: hypothetical protein VFR77_08195 [Steroidobacteraceae bacterium]|nr:hypothetical protein [Steroidobacteraceae bacterium]
MNRRMKLAAAVSALGLTSGCMAQADDSNCTDGKYIEPATGQAEPVTKDGDDYKEDTHATTAGDVALLAPATRYFAYEIHDGQTKVSFRIKEGGMLKFKNKSLKENLVITSGATLEPFDDDDDDGTPSKSSVTVGKDSEKGVRIDKRYVAGTCFTFSSRIGQSQEEDPIVIIER